MNRMVRISVALLAGPAAACALGALHLRAAETTPTASAEQAALGALQTAGIRAGLLVVSTADGSKQAAADLDVPPVFDGLIAASGRLYVSLSDWSLVCLGDAQ